MALQAYDRELFCKKAESAYVIYRKSSTYDVFDLYGSRLLVSRPFNHTIMALTENWQVSGIPCEWGIEPVLCRIKAMDLWQNQRIVDELISANEKQEESKERDFRNNVESFLIDFRRPFARMFNDYVVGSTVNKIDKRRLEDGSCKS